MSVHLAPRAGIPQDDSSEDGSMSGTEDTDEEEETWDDWVSN
jgi:hypothetical protein